ncbi:MAG: TolC family protein, partial [Steroidobacteraceae bacterium]
AVEMAPERSDRPWTPAVNAAGEIIAGAKPAVPPEETTFQLPMNTKLANVPAQPQLDYERTYSLAELIDIAQSSNPLTRTAWNAARDVALAAGVVRSSFLPRLSASVVAGYQHSHESHNAQGVDVDDDLTADGTVSALSIQWLLFDFGEREALFNAAKQASVIANIAFTAAHQQVIYEVSLAFYANSAACARARTALRSVKNAQDIQTAAEERYAHDIGTVIDVAQARQATAQAQLVKVQAEGAAQDAYLSLVSAMGISPTTQIKVADVADRKLPPAASESIDRIVADALGRRPDVLTAHAAHLASLENVRAAQAEFLPKFFLSATGAYNASHLNVTAIPSIDQGLPTVNLSGNRRSATIFAGFTVPVYDGGTRAATLKQAQAKAENAEIALTRIREEAVRQIVFAENGVRSSLSAYAASTALATAARTTFDAALAAYRNDVGSLTAVAIAENQLLAAENVATDAYSAALSSAATLALAAGKLGAAPQ